MLECSWQSVATGPAILELYATELGHEYQLQQEFTFRDGSYYSFLTYMFNFTMVGQRGISFCRVTESDSDLRQMEPMIFNVSCFSAINYSRESG